ncbi:hypothetical protein QR680_015196 [Steinernema hermaphroditum]|uniref:HIT-type domain-containing protein n=1 Tax=Steinernema hermaphroditum TaxID=289476 RepID=A0AA39IBG9_9BILA|nr:hypothetical protein QR680_015196 [Steinernema hermaphroditum]
MEVTFDHVQVACVATHPTKSNLIAVGLITGSIQVGVIDVQKNTVDWKWENRLRREVRSMVFSQEGDLLYVLGKNRSLSAFDTETGQRVRVIVESHSEPPTAISLLPLSDSKTGQQLATGDESGAIRTWDFTTKAGVVCEFREQEEMINDLKPYENRLLASSSDATLGCYDYRRRKLYVRSEPVESELLNICVSDKVTYVGSGTGHLQVFVNGEYGNLLERVNTKLEHGVDAIVELRSNLLVVGCAVDDKIWLQNIKPTKRLQYIGEQSGGVDQLQFTCDKKYLISVGSESSITIWDVEDINKRRRRSQKNSASSTISWTRASRKRDHSSLDMVRLEEIPAFAHLGKESTSAKTASKLRVNAKDADPNIMKSCMFCPTEKKDLYVCPRCNKTYCSVRCYRSAQHAICSEKFYESWVRERTGEEEVKPDHSKGKLSFEEFMNAQKESVPTNPDEEGEPLDSDDEDLSYLKEVVQETFDNFEDADDNELQRQLTIAGVAGIGDPTDEEDEEYQMKLLFETLTVEEKREFQKMVDSMAINAEGLTNSCFGKRM